MVQGGESFYRVLKKGQAVFLSSPSNILLPLILGYSSGAL
jgi:hypothetical protein